jgi:putative ABC transport system permease protein
MSIIYYVIEQKYKSSIQNLLGYNILSIYGSILNPILFIFFMGGFVVNSIIAIYFYISSKCNYIFIFYFQSNIFLWIVSIILALLIILFITFINKNTNILLVLKGKRTTTSLNTTILINKIIISLIMCFIVGSLFNQYNDLQQKLENVKYWDKTKNIYKTTISNQGQLDNLVLDRQYNDRLYSLYKELKINKNAFIINAVNYSILGKNDDKITYLYNININKGNYEYGPHGKSIQIDEGYLRVNPIKLSNNKILKDSLNPENNILNILVPEKYKSMEKDIYNSYLDYFYFQKITVDDMYNKALNLPLNNTSRKDLRVNIIYVKNNQKYFTY